MKRTRAQSHRWGMIAEYLCMAWLFLKGYTILAWRHRVPAGEIDIIAKQRREIVFIEVKARAQARDALESVTSAKRQHVMQVAQGFMASRYAYRDHSLRFDVMVVTSGLRINHLKDAWRA